MGAGEGPLMEGRKSRERGHGITQRWTEGCRKESGLSRWESKAPLLPRRMSVESFSVTRCDH